MTSHLRAKEVEVERRDAGGLRQLVMERRERPRYYVKWKGVAYLHCSWETHEDLLLKDAQIKGKIRRFEQSLVEVDEFGNIVNTHEIPCRFSGAKNSR